MQIAIESTIHMIASSLQRFSFKIKINKCVNSSSVSCFTVVFMLQTINMKQPVLPSFFCLWIFFYRNEPLINEELTRFPNLEGFLFSRGRSFGFPWGEGWTWRDEAAGAIGAISTGAISRIFWCNRKCSLTITQHSTLFEDQTLANCSLSHHHSTQTGKIFTFTPTVSCDTAHSSSSATRTMTTSFSRWHVTFYIFPAPPADPTFRILKPGALTHSYEGRRWRASAPAQLPGSQGAGTQVTEQGGKEGR